MPYRTYLQAQSATSVPPLSPAGEIAHHAPSQDPILHLNPETPLLSVPQSLHSAQAWVWKYYIRLR